ncbi:MAG: GTPase, partial [Pollutimonas bauzanensis]
MSSYSGNIFMVVAPSGAGKSSLVNALLDQDPSLVLSISCTTRAPRPGEQADKHYRCVSADE